MKIKALDELALLGYIKSTYGYPTCKVRFDFIKMARKLGWSQQRLKKALESLKKIGILDFGVEK